MNETCLIQVFAPRRSRSSRVASHEERAFSRECNVAGRRRQRSDRYFAAQAAHGRPDLRSTRPSWPSQSSDFWYFGTIVSW
ncbi:MAG: hypothetical protein FWF87_08465 [Synergistaceae bacterium]|nr:hypothetical protein [Synergistaceae bacterium]